MRKQLKYTLNSETIVLDLGSTSLLEEHNLETWGDGPQILDCIEPLANHLNLSLRQLEKVYTNLAVFYITVEKGYSRIVPAIVFLAVVKVVDSALFNCLLYQTASYDEVSDKLNLTNMSVENQENTALFDMTKIIKVVLQDKDGSEKLYVDPEFQDIFIYLKHLRIKRDQVIPLFAKQISMFEIT